MESKEGVQFAIRAGKREDWPFVYGTWLNSFRVNSTFARHIDQPTYFAMHHHVVERLLERGELLIATPEDDPDTYLGYAVREQGTPVVHYVYVKPAFRRFGVARALLAGLPPDFTYTHHTHVLRDLAGPLAAAKYNPYMV